ncbi:alanine racemase [Stackebrandtia endophytica]|uniref:Alanine racemase n=2 Tax=Stackebrandtia endophytica TaxID=1496996 RepID=A0A543AVF0_9ACTN|nr:alanine racemase [Stackebrandtia endophytica]
MICTRLAAPPQGPGHAERNLVGMSFQGEVSAALDSWQVDTAGFARMKPLRDFQAEALVDLDAISANVSNLAARTDAGIMPAVKADGYGHGLVPVARACLAADAAALGVATVAEAMTLRVNGVNAPVLAWLIAPGLDLAPAIDAEVDLAASSREQLTEFAATAATRPARVHLEADTGMGRGGVPEPQWGAFVEQAAKAQANGKVEIVGVWSHLACADEPGHPNNTAQREAFDRFLAAVAAAGLSPRWRHLANSAAMLTEPGTHFDLVRPGIAVYGYSPIPGRDYGLRPAMTLRARLTQVKRLPAGHGISYGRTHVTDRETTVAIAPLGYADGIPRSTSNLAEVSLAGERVPIRGRVCMDQVVIDCGDRPVAPGDVVEFFGAETVTADDWAAWHDTISYEILTSVGARVDRRYVGAVA